MRILHRADTGFRFELGGGGGNSVTLLALGLAVSACLCDCCDYCCCVSCRVSTTVPFDVVSFSEEAKHTFPQPSVTFFRNKSLLKPFSVVFFTFFIPCFFRPSHSRFAAGVASASVQCRSQPPVTTSGHNLRSQPPCP